MKYLKEWLYSGWEQTIWVQIPYYRKQKDENDMAVHSLLEVWGDEGIVAIRRNFING